MTETPREDAAIAARAAGHVTPTLILYCTNHKHREECGADIAWVFVTPANDCLFESVWRGPEPASEFRRDLDRRRKAEGMRKLESRSGHSEFLLDEAPATVLAGCGKHRDYTLSMDRVRAALDSNKARITADEVQAG